MRVRLAIFFVLSLSAVADEQDAARAWHRQQRVTWSGKTGVPVETISRMWQAAMPSVSENSFGEGIELLDATALRSRRHLLFVTAGGNGHCLTLRVFKDTVRGPGLIWQLNELTVDGGGICHEYLLPYPTAYARPTGDIVVQVPTGAAWLKRDRLGDYPVSTALLLYTYRWNGTTYALATTNRVVTYESTTFNPEKCPQDRPCQ
jgi:hypothetical protein